MKKRLLIFGSSGLLGHSLNNSIPSNQYEIVTHSATDPSSMIQGDLTNPEICKKIINECSPHSVINLVAQTNVDLCEKDPELAYKTNALVVKNIVDALVVNNESNFLHISTDQIYDYPGENVESNIKLKNYYSYSKFLAEVFASSYPKHIILRTNFFGKSLTSKRESLSDWIIKSFKNNVPVSLFNDVYFSPLHMNTLCELILKIILNPKYGTFNLGSNKGMSKKDFALAIANHLMLSSSSAKEISVKDMQLMAFRPTGMLMDNSLFENTYNIKLPNLTEEIRKLTIEG